MGCLGDMRSLRTDGSAIPSVAVGLGGDGGVMLVDTGGERRKE